MIEEIRAQLAELQARLCGYCGHPRSSHCNAGTMHPHYKDQMRQVKRPRMSACVGNHCTEPLCSCVDFQEAAIMETGGDAA